MMKIKIICLFLLLMMTFSLASCFGKNSDGSTPDPNDGTTPPDDQKPGQNDENAITGSEKIINVYLIAGQSNAVGYGMDTNKTIANSDERFVNGFDNVLYYGSQERWSGTYPNQLFKPVKLGMGVDINRSGAEIGIASAVADNGEMNAIIKCAWGATHLYPDTEYEISLNQGTWTSPGYIEKNNVDLSRNPLIGNMYNRFVDTVTKGIQLLIEDGYTPVIKGVWWMQGEAEMFTFEMASSYKELYETLISDTRNMLSEVTGYDCSRVPFVCGLPKWNTRNSAAPAYQTHVRNAMISVADTNENVGYVDCMPLNQHDDWHFDAAGQKYLGENFVACLEDFEISDDASLNEKISISRDVKLLAAERGMEFRADLTSYSSANGYEYGFIVVPTAELINKKITHNYINKLDILGVEYKNISAKVSVEEIDEDYSDIYFTCRLTEVAYEDLNTSYTAIAYIKDQYGLYVYSSAYVHGSVAGLASRALYTAIEDLDEIKKIVNAGINYLNGVPAENGDKAPEFEILVEDNINLNFSESLSEYKLDAKLSVDANYYMRFSSNNPDIVSVDANGVLVAHNLGETFILIECAGKTKRINVSVSYTSMDGVLLDGVISEGEYIGEIITAENGSLSVKFSGMIKNNNLYLAFELLHGDWSPMNGSWWLNDNIEFKLNNGNSHTVIFYEGVAAFSNNISHGISNTVSVDGKQLTTVELCVENISGVQQLKVGMNGANFGWLGALWHDLCNTAYIGAEGIITDAPINIGNGIILDGVFDEELYTENVKANTVTSNANGANVSIMGTLTDSGVLFGVTVDHKQDPKLTLDPNPDSDSEAAWFTYMNIEFHFNSNSGLQFISTAKNMCSLGIMSQYCKSVETDNGYRSTFEIFIPYRAIGVSSNTSSIEFTANGWFENGWCWMLNNSWDATHVVSVDGIAKK